MKELFLPYELAVIAKEKGFNEKCLAYYRILEKKPDLKYYNMSSVAHKNDRNSKLKGEYLTAPLYQQIVDWFREKHEIYIHVEFATSLQRYFGEIQERKKPDDTILAPGYNRHGSDINEDTHYEAFNKAIEEAFKLI